MWILVLKGLKQAIIIEALHAATAYLGLSTVNRPFYRYGGHIELIRFKEYYRMLRGHEHISFVFSNAFRDIFFKVFLE